jgi:A/G-specific adenine glycosylase
MTPFSQTLLNWYYEHQRTLPWRNETDPYKIWVSEIILQQTRVNQGWNYYLSFIEHFPTIQDLAEAPEEKFLKCGKDWATIPVPDICTKLLAM